MSNTFDGYAVDQVRGMMWCPSLGMGFYPVDPSDEPYDAAYFEKYQGYAKTEMGRNLTQARVDFVRAHWGGPVVDIGIGCGAFVEAHGNATGYDVNPVAVEWLSDRGLWQDVYADGAQALTAWDALEHVEDPWHLVSKAGEWLFTSIPVFSGTIHEVMASKHFRTDEHRWYWTDDGFRRWAKGRGFEVVSAMDFEQQLGRDDILTYAMRRVQK